MFARHPNQVLIHRRKDACMPPSTCSALEFLQKTALFFMPWLNVLKFCGMLAGVLRHAGALLLVAFVVGSNSAFIHQPNTRNRVRGTRNFALEEFPSCESTRCSFLISLDRGTPCHVVEQELRRIIGEDYLEHLHAGTYTGERPMLRKNRGIAMKVTTSSAVLLISLVGGRNHRSTSLMIICMVFLQLENDGLKHSDELFHL
jgi:hypothetical protein